MNTTAPAQSQATLATANPLFFALPNAISLSLVIGVVIVRQFLMSDLLDRIVSIQENQALALEKLEKTLDSFKNLIIKKN